jgi:hypothetical protein
MCMWRLWPQVIKASGGFSLSCLWRWSVFGRLHGRDLVPLYYSYQSCNSRQEQSPKIILSTIAAPPSRMLINSIVSLGRKWSDNFSWPLSHTGFAHPHQTRGFWCFDQVVCQRRGEEFFMSGEPVAKVRHMVVWSLWHDHDLELGPIPRDNPRTLKHGNVGCSCGIVCQFVPCT